VKSKRRAIQAVALREESGQGVVEFALLATVLLLLFLGGVDYARFIYYKTAIISAARIGAETAINHCPFASSACGTSPTQTSDSLTMWKTYCEAQPSVSLNPGWSSCTAGTSSTWTPTCNGSCNNCTQDICVTHSGSDVTVTVGYSFKAITPLMAPFFSSDISCFSGDSTSSNHHTLCASSTGKVS